MVVIQVVQLIWHTVCYAREYTTQYRPVLIIVYTVVATDKGMSENMEEWEEVERETKEQMTELFSGGMLTDLVIRKRDNMVVPR